MSVGILEPYLGTCVPWLYVESRYWTCVGLFGNALFTSRFLIQWIKSERRQKIVIPPIFWHLSFWGSVVSLIYALHIDKLPIILAFAFLPFMYFRNLRLLRKGTAAGADANSGGSCQTD